MCGPEKELYYGEEKFGRSGDNRSDKGRGGHQKTKKTAEVHPPTVYMWSARYRRIRRLGSLYRIGAWAAENGVDGQAAIAQDET